MTHRVVFTPEARTHLLSILRYISAESGAGTGSEYVSAIVDYCESFATFPSRGTRRDDLRPGLRTIGFRKRVTVAFVVDARTVVIIGIFYGGQDIETKLAPST